MIANYCPFSYIYFCCAFWKRLIYQMEIGSFPDRLIPNTYIYDVRSYCYSAVIYSTLISLTVFLTVKKCAFVTMHGGSIVPVFNEPELCLC